MVLQHHERFDGKGYPDGLSGEEIELGARILAVADVFDALKSDRPYREGWSLERVNELILNEGGRQFDPQVVEAFLAIMTSKGVKAA
jgi:HD-GYP domain-containing protein (c-di-GMP phosphodiesterase class II)